MKYHTQPGVVTAKIAGENLLIASGEARGKVPYVKNINQTGVWFWKEMEKSLDLDQIAADAVEYYGISPEKAESACKGFFETLLRDNYVIIDEQDPRTEE